MHERQHMDDLNEFTWVESDAVPVINFHGKYDYPVIHRGTCQGRYPDLATSCPEIGEDGLLQAWESEMKRRAKGVKSLEFCGHCVCKPVT